MSHRASLYIWDSTDAKGSELLVLLAIADMADDDGFAWPGYGTLARKTRLSKRQVARIVGSLEETGALEVVERGGWRGGRNEPNRYRIVGVELRSDILSTPPRAEGGGVDTHDDTGVDTAMSPEPSLEPSKKEKNGHTPLHEQEDAIRAVFDAWVEAAQPERKNLSASHKRSVQKILRETQDVDYALRAVRGYVAYRRATGKRLDLSGMNSYPGSGSFGDRVDFFASEDPGASLATDAAGERQPPLSLLGAMQRMWDARDQHDRALLDMERVRQTIEADGFIVNHDADGRPVALRAREENK